jgi:hypothetical protein
MDLLFNAFRRLASLLDGGLASAEPPTPSGQLDQRYDNRQAAIEALQGEARARGHEVPTAFLDSLYACSDPYWVDKDSRRISIFQADGTIGDDAKVNILAALADGRLQRQADEVEARTLDRMGELEHRREALVASFEGQSGIQLDAALRDRLVSVGSFKYRDPAGHYREVNLNASSAALIEGEMQELAKLVTGQPIDVDAGDAAEQQAADIRRFMAADFGLRSRSS